MKRGVRAAALRSLAFFYIDNKWSIAFNLSIDRCLIDENSSNTKIGINVFYRDMTVVK